MLGVDTQKEVYVCPCCKHETLVVIYVHGELIVYCKSCGLGTG